MISQGFWHVSMSCQYFLLHKFDWQFYCRLSWSLSSLFPLMVILLSLCIFPMAISHLMAGTEPPMAFLHSRGERWCSSCSDDNGLQHRLHASNIDGKVDKTSLKYLSLGHLGPINQLQADGNLCWYWSSGGSSWAIGHHWDQGVSWQDLDLDGVFGSDFCLFEGWKQGHQQDNRWVHHYILQLHWQSRRPHTWKSYSSIPIFMSKFVCWSAPSYCWMFL